MSTQHEVKVGDIWHRVDGTYIDDGSEQYRGMELRWQQWRVIKLTPAGAWLRCITWPYQHKKPRFALATGARWVSRTKAEALEGLMARKRRHIAIVEHQAEAARETFNLASAELAKLNGGAS